MPRHITQPFDLDVNQTLSFLDPILQYQSLVWQQIIYAGKLMPYRLGKYSTIHSYKYQGGLLP